MGAEEKDSSHRCGEERGAPRANLMSDLTQSGRNIMIKTPNLYQTTGN